MPSVTAPTPGVTRQARSEEPKQKLVVSLPRELYQQLKDHAHRNSISLNLAMLEAVKALVTAPPGEE
jgi:hypothetical protein